MINMPSRSQASSSSGVGGLCERANGVAAEFLQLVNAEFLQRIRNGRANAGVILVIADAVDRVRLAVQHETLFGSKTTVRMPKMVSFWSTTLSSTETVVTSL